jgi:hypothetical protein
MRFPVLLTTFSVFLMPDVIPMTVSDVHPTHVTLLSPNRNFTKLPRAVLPGTLSHTHLSENSLS